MSHCTKCNSILDKFEVGICNACRDEQFKNFGKQIASELGIDLQNSTIEENCGTVWVTDDQGETYSISMMKCESEVEDEVA